MKKRYLKQTGQTSDGRRIFSGLYKFYETIGLPLDTLLSCFQEKNILPDWIDFYQSARKAGMEHGRIISKLEADISDSFGKELADQVILKLDKLYIKSEE
jgi:hypothetical protein